MNMKEIENNVGKYFSTRPEINVGYLFGSTAKGEESKLSDIDIAILVDEEKLPKELSYRYKANVITELMKVLRTEKVDLVILNESPLFLCFRVIHDGVILYSDNEKKRIDFEVKIMRRYLDRKFYYDRHINLSLAAVAEEGIL
jgi:hypothetical protein